MNPVNKPALMERSRKFWAREKTDRPLIGFLFNRMAPLSSVSDRFSSNNLIFPESLTDKLFIEDCERRFLAAEKLPGESMFVAYPYIGLPWLDAIMGSSVFIGGGSAWSVFNTDWRTYSAQSVPWDNGWFDLMLRQIRLALEHSKGRFPVGPCHLRGIGDVVAELVGQEEFCLALYDDPGRISELISITSDVWVKIVDAMYQILEPDEGGYWNGNQPLWTPGRTMFVPADIVSLISRDMFNDFFLEPLERMLGGLDYSIMHTHSSYLHAVEDILHIEELKAIQVGIDPNGPNVKKLLPIMRSILDKKSLIIAGDTSPELLSVLIRELPAEGLSILIYKETVEECQIVYEQLEKVL